MEGLISLPSYESVFAACDLLPRHGSYLWGSPPAAPLTELAASLPSSQRASRQASAEAPAPAQRSSSGGFSAGGFLAALASALANISMIAPPANGIPEFTSSSNQESSSRDVSSSSRNSSGSFDAPAQAPPPYNRRSCKRGVRRHVLASLPCRYLDTAAAGRAAEHAASSSSATPADSRQHTITQQGQQGRQGQLTAALDEEDEDECALCMETYRAAIVMLPCKHEFCQACVNQWLSQHTNCPLCRWEFPPEQQRRSKRIT